MMHADPLDPDTMTSDNLDPLPAGYHEEERRTAVVNIAAGFDQADLLHLRRARVAATQRLRAQYPSWGWRFASDPRKFSSTPQPR